MAASQGYKDLVADGVWASADTAFRTLPEDEGIDRTVGFGVAYEQLGSGALVGRGEWNNYRHELTAALIDISAHGVLPWSADLNYVPDGDEWCFTKTSSGLWRTNVATGPAYGNATDPDTAGQTIWRRF